MSDMRGMIGKRIIVHVSDEGDVKGKLVFEDKAFIYLKMEDDRVKRIVKNKICSFIFQDKDDDDMEEFVPFHLMYCENKLIKCEGVQFVQEGPGVKRGDFEKFMGGCPCRDDCSFGTKGELRSVSGEYLNKVFGNTMFGCWPDKKEEPVKEAPVEEEKEDDDNG